jgi:LPXTG-motif cell wall-anchored protein
VQAAENEPFPVVSDCNEGWYVNPDEGARLPEQTEAGFLFQPADLVHRQTNIPLADLEPGSYVAAPAPDAPSFFSVEVVSPNTNAYGTLRWVLADSVWSITIGPGGSATAGTFYNADPVALLTDKVTKWGAFDLATATVVSFGVGYTQNPPGTIETVVSEVEFAAQTYDLTCQPPTTTGTDPETTTTTGGELPKTGANLTGLLATGVALVLVGAATVLVLRRRRAHE